MNNKVLIAICGILTFLLLGTIYISHMQLNRYKVINRSVTFTDTVYQTYQFTDTLVKPVYVKKVETDTVIIVKNDGTEVKQNLSLKQKYYSDTIKVNGDTLSYSLSITGRSLDDEDYPRLDNIDIKGTYKQTNTIKYVPYEVKTNEKQSRFKISPQIGVGYGFINRKPDIYLGVGLSYNF